MNYSVSKWEKVFTVFNYTFLALLALSCILPLIHVLAISFSSKTATGAGLVGFWPVDFTFESYKYILAKKEFIRAVGVTIERLLFNIPLSMFITILVAYPLSKENKSFRGRTIYVWIFMFTILFSGGLIPFYMTIRLLGLLDTIWALVLPSVVQVFNIVLMLNFFRGLPKEMEESAFIDGANHWTVLWKIVVPTSTPSLATILLFTAVGQWNSWFDGIILMNSTSNYPLQSYLQVIVMQATMKIGNSTSSENWRVFQLVSDKTAKSAQIFLGALPVLIVYPFLQKYFVKGIVLGSVKG